MLAHVQAGSRDLERAAEALATRLPDSLGVFARLAAPGGFTGERFLERCAPALGEEGALVEGLHVFTFNQIGETEAWRTDMLERLRDGR